MEMVQEFPVLRSPSKMGEEDCVTSPKVSGYLEKKGKMKVMSSYKRYWFVLEGRLLLYYRSKDEYEGISPCKGSINLGPPCNIKPCASTNGVHVFQIETRSTTITLRAESQEEQNRWMQGIMSALNLNLNSKKLGHFRYSLDELPQEMTGNSVLKRKNTIPPHSDSPKSQSSKEKSIIERLQKIGAQSYGGSMDAIHQRISRHSSTTCNDAIQDPGKSTEFRSSVLIENDQYGMINKALSAENIELRRGPGATENIYERISNDSTISTHSKEHNYSVPSKINVISKESLLKGDEMNEYDIKHTSDTESQRRPTTFLLENETYEGIPSEKRPSQTSFIENNYYYAVDKDVLNSNRISEVIYAEPKCNEITNNNEHNLLLNKIKGEENAYSVTKLYESERNSVNSTQYEDLEKYAICTETISQTEYATNNKSKHKKDKNKKQSKDKACDNKKEFKLKKSSSFIKRVWKKKGKHKGKEENIEELYETVPEAVVDKLTLTDDAAVQMLSELQNILEHKKPVLLDHSQFHDQNQNETVTRTSSNENPQSPVDNLATIEMLTELQSILKDKKASLSVASSESQSTECPTPDQGRNKTSSETSSSSSRSENVCPVLPAKRDHKDDPSPHHDIPKNNQTPPSVLPPKKRQTVEDNLSLDEILDDLDKEKDVNFSKCKVKKLIKQFSESDIECDVELRKNKRTAASREDIDSNELNRLLDELTKVTYAPILTPGVTSSLVTPNLTDEELIKLLPPRRRRHSDPDYDVPRPHTSLVNLPKDEVSPDNAIGSTRFFGPILTADTNDKKQDTNVGDSPQPLSITPDSLEPELVQLSKCTPMPRLWEDDKTSYRSHSYIQLRQCNTNNNARYGDAVRRHTTHFQNNLLIENDIYAQPKTLANKKIAKIQRDNETIKRLFLKEASDENVEDVSIDSLEIGT